MSTIHANGAADALARLETLTLLADSGLPLAAVRAQFAASIDAVVHVARRAGGIRRVETIAEVVDDASLDGHRARVRVLFALSGAELRAVGAPLRPARRPGAPALERRWFAC
jgi:pilus assembly protein CpaF